MVSQLTVTHDFKTEGRRSDNSPQPSDTSAARRTTLAGGRLRLNLFRRSGNRLSTVQLFIVIASLALFSTVSLQFKVSEQRKSFTRNGEGGGTRNDAYEPTTTSHLGSVDKGSGEGNQELIVEKSATTFAEYQEWEEDGPQHIDRRFRGQKTGRLRKAEKELFIHSSSVGQFGWGTDWAVGVSVPLEKEGHDGAREEGVINPPWCAAPANRSFVEYVYTRRSLVDPYDRVASCVRTKDMGRYLPEWIAYHWALGVDEFMVYDDESIDDTREVLEPFIRAGIVKFRQRRIPAVDDRVAPLNDCLQEYRDRHDRGDFSAPRWIILTDTDEYIFSGDIVSTLSDVLATYSDTCCLKIPSVRYGSSGLRRPPRGLVIENYLMHADPSANQNGPPKLVANMRPAKPESGAFRRLLDPTQTESCQCDTAPVAELAVNHYIMTPPDYRARKRRQWGRDKDDWQPSDYGDYMIQDRDANKFSSDAMLIWSCVMREVLDRVANGRHMVTDKPLPGLSPHHPATHGLRPMDPFSVSEQERTMSCMATVRESPNFTGTSWEKPYDTPYWLKHFCSMRYIFVHSFEGTGGQDAVRLISAHEWVKSHNGGTALSDGGAALTSAFPGSIDLRGAGAVAIELLCGCSMEEMPGCWRYCPRVQATIVDLRVNQTRRQLFQDWVLRFNFERQEPAKPGAPIVLVERDTDMLLASKQELFPSVSRSVLTVRHPFCTPAVATFLDGADEDRKGQGLAEWLSVWRHVLTEQLPKIQGDVWVVRYEDIIVQEEEVASALWAAVALPPLFPFPPSPVGVGSNIRFNKYGEPEKLRRPLSASLDPAAMARNMEMNEERWASEENAPASRREKPTPDVSRQNSLKALYGKKSESLGQGSQPKTGANIGAFRNGIESEEQRKRSAEPGGVHSTRRSLLIGDALSRAPYKQKETAAPLKCRNRIAACDEHPACVRERRRALTLMDFFGYGQVSAQLLNAQRFLWGKEELLWLGRRLEAAQEPPPESPIDDGRVDYIDEPSETLPGIVLDDIFSISTVDI